MCLYVWAHTYFNQQSSRIRSTHKHNVVWNKIYVGALCSNIGQETSNAVSNALCGSTFISAKRRGVGVSGELRVCLEPISEMAGGKARSGACGQPRAPGDAAY